MKARNGQALRRTSTQKFQLVRGGGEGSVTRAGVGNDREWPWPARKVWRAGDGDDSDWPWPLDEKVRTRFSRWLCYTHVILDQKPRGYNLTFH